MPVIRSGHENFEGAGIEEEDDVVDVPPTTTPFSRPFVSTFDDTPTAPNLEHETLANIEAFSLPLPSSTKRPHIDQSSDETDLKRVRLVSQPEQSFPITAGLQEGKHTGYGIPLSERKFPDLEPSGVTPASAMSMAESKMQNVVDDDSDDDSDFEVPPLIFATGAVDEED
jgi:hypothetical protein